MEYDIYLDDNTIMRFWAKVNMVQGKCWEWMATRNLNGYGQLRVKDDYGKWRKGLSHRVSWIIHNGNIPNSLCVLHHCDNPGCVNPSHLFLGTYEDNSRDMITKGRGKPSHLYGEKNGSSKLTREQVSEIRKHLCCGENHYYIARKFGVSHTTIWRIARGKSWIH